MQKGKYWDGLLVQQHHFETLKASLQQAPVLIHPDHTKPYMLDNDAADVGVRATLSQLDTEGLSILVACRLRKLNNAQLK